MRFVDYLARADKDEAQNLFYLLFEQDEFNDDYCVTERSFDNMYAHLLGLKDTVEENDNTILFYPFKIPNDVWNDDYFLQYGASLVSMKELRGIAEHLSYDEIFEQIKKEKNQGYRYIESLKKFPRSTYSLEMEFAAMPQIYRWAEVPSAIVAGMQVFAEPDNHELVNLICAAVLFSTTIWGTREDEHNSGHTFLKGTRITTYGLERDIAKCEYLEYLYRMIGYINREISEKPEFPFGLHREISQTRTVSDDNLLL